MRNLLWVVAIASCGHAAAPEKSGPVPDTTKIRRGDKPLTLLGPTLDVGAALPDFTVYDKELKPVKLSALHKPIVISVVPSIDTKVCESQTHHVEAMAGELPPGTEVYEVSRDLPFAQSRFTDEAQISHVKLLSDYRDRSFGTLMGLEVGESGLLARSIWVIGSDGKIAYRQLVPDQGEEPELDPVIAAIKAAK
ncbi:MAG: thiol peroxidase [Kofleriaceae bacterium]